jgi:hypothetical protein
MLRASLALLARPKWDPSTKMYHRTKGTALLKAKSNYLRSRTNFQIDTQHTAAQADGHGKMSKIAKRATHLSNDLSLNQRRASPDDLALARHLLFSKEASRRENGRARDASRSAAYGQRVEARDRWDVGFGKGRRTGFTSGRR